MSVQFSFMRYEKKYFLDRRQYELLLGQMERHMKKDVYGQYTICNVYYDTEDWRLVRASIEKPPYKEKLRVRSYGTLARIEVEPSQVTLMAQVNTRNKIIARLTELGYNYVTLDLAGFRSGSMDVGLAKNQQNC